MEFKKIKKNIFLVLSLVMFFPSITKAQEKAYVDFNSYERLVKEVKNHRIKRLINLNDFLEKGKESNTIILDTRSKDMFQMKHVKGAVNINFSNFTQFTLDSLMDNYAGKNTQILIYCNNNFEDKKNGVRINGVPNIDKSFVTKGVFPSPKLQKTLNKIDIVKPELTLALNIPTYINLYGYGYRNIYELNELVDVNDNRIIFEGTLAPPIKN